MVRKMSAEKHALLKLTRELTNISYRHLGKKYGVPKSTAYDVCNAKKKSECEKRKAGRPKALSDRAQRILLRTFFKLRRTSPNFSVKDLIVESGLDTKKHCRRTVSRFLNSSGYKLRQARKKGLLSENDLMIRRKYARNMKKTLSKYPNFFTKHVGFYLDGVSFIHKSNLLKVAVQPKSRVWRSKGEGLTFTAKGSKSLPGGRRLHMMVAIAHRKGVILKEPYEKMDGDFFYNFIKKHFNLTFAKAGPKRYRKRIFVMDNDPSQTR
jgi:transposase